MNHFITGKIFRHALLAGAFGVAASSPLVAQTRTPPQPAAPRATSAQPAPVATQPAPAAQETTAGKGGEIIARVGDSDVTAEEVRATIQLLDARQQAALARDPALLSQTVRAILANRLVLKEAAAKKWDQQPAVVTQLARARDALIVETYLQSVTAVGDSYPGEADIRSVYEANASAFLVPRRFRLAQIVVNLAKDADKAAEDTARRKLDDIVRKLKQPGAEFGAIAKTSSEDAATAGREGEIGWVAEPDMRTEIRSQVTGLPKSGISDPIRLEDGWHILKLVDTEASHTRPLAEVRDAIVQRMRAERVEANRRAYVAELLKQTPPVVNEIALSKLLESRSDATPSR
ncbi:peptidylprolyl isomerase [Bradyrhizobium diazoefficiens]|nr:peptidylprolyl isomerase [Bradyrhizobium diazoefficiens]UCF51448.1 MAG: peptidylprolyl isomerase [Bradyrhizobium sp.]MBR0964151.1 peptidylprolyl isomerase [Bradyrhizobium diazoefficiens]MBR0978311.1 peptidylprolyl isomerase [Bradyrhizobium diazoefficiens]MBR1006242.1 peptidylprolyl isomerase [Bradyrhizobium diazoefficiens]MBR1014294.1 peptidylprolyl isomerase [Bradyrhizobium diazoefficiens]